MIIRAKVQGVLLHHLLDQLDGFRRVSCLDQEKSQLIAQALHLRAERERQLVERNRAIKTVAEDEAIPDPHEGFRIIPRKFLSAVEQVRHFRKIFAAAVHIAQSQVHEIEPEIRTRRIASGRAGKKRLDLLGLRCGLVDVEEDLVGRRIVRVG